MLTSLLTGDLRDLHLQIYLLNLHVKWKDGHQGQESGVLRWTYGVSRRHKIEYGAGRATNMNHGGTSAVMNLQEIERTTGKIRGMTIVEVKHTRLGVLPHNLRQQRLRKRKHDHMDSNIANAKRFAKGRVTAWSLPDQTDHASIDIQRTARSYTTLPALESRLYQARS